MKNPDHPILAFEAALVRAQLGADVAALEQLLDDELHFMGLDGRVFTKADDLAAHRTQQLRITRMDPLKREITPLGPVTLVSVLMETEAVVSGSLVSARIHYTRVWRQHGEDWKVIAGQMRAVDDTR